MKEGWTYKKLGEVAHYPTNRVSSLLMNETNYVGVDNLVKDRGGKTLANYVPSEGNAVEFIKGDILLGNIRPYLKKIWLSDIDGGASGDVLIIRPNDTRQIWSNYLYWALASDHFFEYDTIHCKGAKMPRGNKVDIMNYLLPIPSVEIQQQIVSELDLLSGVIEKQKAQIEELDKLAQSIFYDMFGDPVSNEKGWNLKDMESLCSKIVDCPHSTPQKSEIKTDYPCIRTSELKEGEIYWDSMQYLEEEEYYKRIARLKPEAGDIVFGREGSIGNAVILPKGYYFSLGQRTMLLRVNDCVNNIFLLRTIISEWLRKQIRIANVSSTVAHVNIKDFKKFLIPLPPLALQQEFAEKIEAIESMKAKVRQSLKESEQLFNSRMDYYFN